MAAVSPSAPSRAASCGAPSAPTSANAAAAAAAIPRVWVKTESARRWAPWLFRMENLVAPPMPSKSPVPWMTLYTGMARFSAARPVVPRPWATKKVSARM